ncbi:MAG: histidine kinase [Lachnospiraceae bacterium]|nr:histidine kinase [Lachnospiraceae bacterium]
MNRTYSLKRRMFRLLSGFVCGVLLMGIINGTAAFWGRFQMRMSYELFTLYNDYDDAVRTLRKTAVDYYIDGTEESQADISQKAEELDQLSLELNQLAEDICAYSYHADTLQRAADVFAFQDLCDISGELTRQARAYADSDGETTVQDIQHMAELTLILYDMLQTHVENIVNDSILLSNRIWQFQVWAIVIIFAAMLLYTLYILYHMSRQVLHPIGMLTGMIQRFRGGEEEAEQVPAFSSCYEELLILYEAYSGMTGTIRTQIEELKDKARISEELRKKETALSSAELSLMQSLITPHFLYNCLSTISSLATIERAPRTYKSAVQISRFLRESLNNVGQYVTVWEEVNYTQHYIEIQKLRFGDTIHFSISCDPECARVQVPAILLQPLIENAISHGVKSMSQGGRIDVNVISAEQEVQMSVCDNGMGISEEKQKELKEILESDYTPAQKGVGLRSVAYRLRDIYGQKARVEIESGSGHTKVCLHIPWKKED